MATFFETAYRIHESVNNGKRTSNHLSPPESLSVKRHKIARSIRQYSDSEQWTLHGAARILNVPLECLLSVTESSQSRFGRHQSPQYSDNAIRTSWDDEPAELMPLAQSELQITPSVLTFSPSERRTNPALRPVHHAGVEKQNLEIPEDSSIHAKHPDTTIHCHRFNPLSLSVRDHSAGSDPSQFADNIPNLNIQSNDDDWLNILSDFQGSFPTHPTEIVSTRESSVSYLSSEEPIPSHEPELPARRSQQVLNSCHNFNRERLLNGEVLQIPAQIEQGQNEPVTLTNSQRGKRRGPFQDPQRREDASVVRNLVACVSCSNQRIKCKINPADPKGCCLTCIKAARTRMHWLPCLRYKIGDAELLDHASCPRPSWTKRWKKMEVVDIQDWSSEEIKTIKITQDVNNTSYEVMVRKFRPVDGDSLERRWKSNGVAQSFECTPYAIADMKEAGRTLSEFADRTLGEAIFHYIDNTDPLLWDTYNMAYCHSKIAEREDERLLLRAALRLWNASRMESRSDRICGSEKLGMTEQDYGLNCPNTGHILTPPVFSAQLEVIVVSMILRPAKKEVLTQLKKMIQKGQRRSWFAIYLTMFILLHSCALLTAGQNKKARKQGFKVRFFNNSIVEELHTGAKVLLAYFHYCNKGSYPFSMSWTSPDQLARTELNAEQVDFMRATIRELNQRRNLFQDIKDNGKFEHEYYFLSQLYEYQWEPRHTV